MSRLHRIRFPPLVCGLGIVAILTFYTARLLPQLEDAPRNGRLPPSVASAALHPLPPPRQHQQQQHNPGVSIQHRGAVQHEEAKTDSGGSGSEGEEDEDIVHIVFSTDCSGYQHWQGIALWYAAQFAGHRGPITRIASGCSEEQRAAIAREWAAVDGGRGRFRVHFTPPMELGGEGEGGGEGGAPKEATTAKKAKAGPKYKYSNKPGGLRHWLDHAAPPVRPEAAFVALVDPDMLPLRPLTTRLASKGLGPPTPRTARFGGKPPNQYELIDPISGVARVLAVPLPRKAREEKGGGGGGGGGGGEGLKPLPPRVALGRPAGQHFGIGGQWSRAGGGAGGAWANFSKARVCGEGAPCTRTSPLAADWAFAVGPVYLAHVEDWQRIADQWWANMPRVHAQYPHLLAEMYALTMAVANLSLPFGLASHFMVSDPKTMSPTEAWTWIQDLAALKPQQPRPNAQAAATPSGGGGGGGGNNNNNTGSGEVWWDPGAVCRGADATHLPWATRRRRRNPSSSSSSASASSASSAPSSASSLAPASLLSGAAPWDEVALPSVLHHCQKYELAGHVFAKRKMAHDFFRCGGAPLPFDPEALVRELEALPGAASSSSSPSSASSSSPHQAAQGTRHTGPNRPNRTSAEGAFGTRAGDVPPPPPPPLSSRHAAPSAKALVAVRTGFMLCHLIPLVNAGLAAYQRDVCPPAPQQARLTWSGKEGAG